MTEPETERGIDQPEPDANPVAPDDLATPQFGLKPRAQASKRVIVIGAGMGPDSSRPSRERSSRASAQHAEIHEVVQ